MHGITSKLMKTDINAKVNQQQFCYMFSDIPPLMYYLLVSMPSDAQPACLCAVAVHLLN